MTFISTLVFWLGATVAVTLAGLFVLSFFWSVGWHVKRMITGEEDE